MSYQRGLKNRIRFSNSVDKVLFERLQELSNETMIPISKLLDKGIQLLLKDYGKADE